MVFHISACIHQVALTSILIEIPPQSCSVKRCVGHNLECRLLPCAENQDPNVAAPASDVDKISKVAKGRSSQQKAGLTMGLVLPPVLEAVVTAVRKHQVTTEGSRTRSLSSTGIESDLLTHWPVSQMILQGVNCAN